MLTDWAWPHGELEMEEREVGDEPLGTATAADPRATDRGGLKNQNGNGRVLIRKLHVVCNV